MIAYLKGHFAIKTPTYTIVDVGGVGYHVNITLTTFSSIEKLESGLLHTHLIVKEDSHTLFGFSEQDERTVFVQLLSVSGIGAATAQILLSSLTTNQVRESIAAENDLTFSRVKGIGPKTAKRIILDLKDKISKDFTQNGNIPIHQGNMMKEEALFALLALGFQRQAAGTALQKVLKENDNIASLEALIKAALSQLSS